MESALAEPRTWSVWLGSEEGGEVSGAEEQVSRVCATLKTKEKGQQGLSFRVLQDFFSFPLVLGMEPRSVGMLRACCTTELYHNSPGEF